jgi:hypothetical protein
MAMGSPLLEYRRVKRIQLSYVVRKCDVNVKRLLFSEVPPVQTILQ